MHSPLHSRPSRQILPLSAVRQLHDSVSAIPCLPHLPLHAVHASRVFAILACEGAGEDAAPGAGAAGETADVLAAGETAGALAAGKTPGALAARETASEGSARALGSTAGAGA